MSFKTWIDLCNHHHKLGYGTAPSPQKMPPALLPSGQTLLPPLPLPATDLSSATVVWPFLEGHINAIKQYIKTSFKVEKTLGLYGILMPAVLVFRVILL